MKDTLIKDPIKSLLPRLGALGHTVVVFERNDDPMHGGLYGGWRNICEASHLEHVQDLLATPGRRVYQKTTKRGKYGAVVETWKDVTPGLEQWPQTLEEAHKLERCYVCAKPTERIRANPGRGFRARFCGLCRNLLTQPELLAHRREERKQSALVQAVK